MNSILIIYLNNTISNYKECYDFLCLCLDKNKGKDDISRRLKKLKNIKIKCIDNVNSNTDVVWKDYCNDKIRFESKVFEDLKFFDNIKFIVNVSENRMNLKYFVMMWQVIRKKYSRIDLSAIMYSDKEKDYFIVSHLLKNVLLMNNERNSFGQNVLWGEKTGGTKTLSKKQNKTNKNAPFELISYDLIKNVWSIPFKDFLKNFKKVTTYGGDKNLIEKEILLAAFPSNIRDNKKIMEYIKKEGLNDKRIAVLSQNSTKEFAYFRTLVNFLIKGSESNAIYLFKLFQKEIVSQSPFMNIYLMSLLFVNDSEKLLEQYDKSCGTSLPLSLLEQDLLYTRDITDGIVQLLENVIVHTSENIGVLVMEFVNIEVRDNKKYFRFWIGDYSRQGIMSTFKKNVIKLKGKEGYNIDEINDIIKGLERKKISFFFDPKEDEELIWDKYNRLPGVIAHHYGLQLFKSLIKANRGYFKVQSHNQVYYSSKEETVKEEIQVVPGTQYSIDIPIEHNLSMVTTGIKSNVKYTNIKDLDYLFINGFNFNREFINEIYKGIKNDLRFAGSSIAEKKEEFIKRVKLKLDECILDDENNKIVLFDVSQIAIVKVELLCKAIVMFMSLTQCKNYNFAFINCSEYFIIEMVRMFSVFYGKNGKFQYINNVQIYFCGGQKKASLEFLLAGSSLGTVVANAQKYAFFSGFRPSSLNYLELMLEKRSELNGFNESTLDSQDLIPFDLLCNDYIIDEFFHLRPPQMYIYYKNISKGYKSLFEYKVEEILIKNIQDNEWGCYLDNVHIRLGKDIHIDGFYEAELLFHNSLYTYRFARILLQSIVDIIEEGQYQNYVLVGYETYSEMLLYETYNMIDDVYKKDDKISYIVYEQRQIIQTYKNRVDKKQVVEDFRYIKRSNESDPDKDYYKNACFLIVVPIGTTLKTFTKIRKLLVSKLSLEGDIASVNYSLILVGDINKENEYWEKPSKRKITTKEEFSSPSLKINYLINVKAKWWNANECKVCFPNAEHNIDTKMYYLKERPLIDTNRASIVPMVKFGTREDFMEKKENTANTGDYEAVNEKRIELLRDCLVYGHVERNDNHFMYYIKTEDLFHNNRNEIKEWLKSLSDERNRNDQFVYDFIVSPMHYSNTGFIEEVNIHAFQGSSYVIYLEINKEFRSNIKAKFSNITMLYYNLMKEQKKAKLRFHYVDDMIITGRTFYRMKSLIQSLFPDEVYDDTSCVQVELYHSIILLLNRNSRHSLSNYMNKGCKIHYFINLNVSVMRSFEDACVLCKHIEECKRISAVSSTKEMYSYWNYQMIKHQLRPMYLGYKDKKNKDHAFYRMRCIHRVNIKFEEMGLSINDENNVVLKIKEIIESSGNLDELISYFKVMSRPFITYHVVIKSAIFKFNLYCLNFMLFGCKTIPKNELKIYQDFFQNINSILRGNEKTLILIILSSLANLESNYIIRKEVIKALYDKYENDPSALRKIKIFIKKIIYKNEDESKSLWLENLLIKGTEDINSDDIDEEFINSYGIFSTFGQSLYLENTSIIRDAIEQPSKCDEISRNHKKIMELNGVQKYGDLNCMRKLKELLDAYKKPESEIETEAFYHNLAMYAANIMGASNTYLFIRSKNKTDEDDLQFNIINCFLTGHRKDDCAVSMAEISRFAGIDKEVAKLYRSIKEKSYYSEKEYVLVKFDNNMSEADSSKLNSSDEEKEIFSIYKYEPVYMLFQYEEGGGDVLTVNKNARIQYWYSLRNLLTLRTEIFEIIEKDFNNEIIQSLCEKQEKMNLLLKFKSISHTAEGDYERIYAYIKESYRTVDERIIAFFFNSLIAVAYNKYLSNDTRGLAQECIREKAETLEKFVEEFRGLIQYYMHAKEIVFEKDDADSNSNKQETISDSLFSETLGKRRVRRFGPSGETYNKMYFAAFLIDMLRSVYRCGSSDSNKLTISVSEKENKILFKNPTPIEFNEIDMKNRHLQKALKGKGEGGISLFVAKKFFEQGSNNVVFNAYYEYNDSDRENKAKVYYVVEWPILEGE